MKEICRKNLTLHDVSIGVGPSVVLLMVACPPRIMPAWTYAAEGQSPALTRRCYEVEARSPMLPTPEAWIPVDSTGAGGLALFLISGRCGEDRSVASGETRSRVSTRAKWTADGSDGRNDRGSGV
jgi:hypothetical protein